MFISLGEQHKTAQFTCYMEANLDPHYATPKRCLNESENRPRKNRYFSIAYK